ncbi:MAG TPA: hypothetical protein VLF66_03870, partial [Thermoanaerobaculia bacterium]|nr:hypothetical protein [Thermoanaerobaculia bacterium]
MPTLRIPSAPPVSWTLAALLAALAVPAPATAQGGPLFPEPFVVEHRLVQTDGDGERFETEPVTDYYGGSWIVSVRPDGSRLVVDLARREVTEVRPDRGVFWSLDFGRLAELTERAAQAQWRKRAGAPDEAPAPASLGAKEAPAELVVQELPAGGTVARRSGGSATAAVATAPPGVRRLRVVDATRAEDPDAGVEVWLDPSVRMRPAALAALTALETALAGGRGGEKGDGGPPVARHLAAARSHAAGAVPVRTIRTLGSGPPSARVRLEDVTSRLEPLDDFPEELVAVPEGLRRAPHPLEGVVAFLEDEAERARR